MSSSVKTSGIYACFSMPMPCSPLNAPPASMQASSIRSPPLDNAPNLGFVATVEEDARVEVTVTGVENVPNGQTQFFANRSDLPHDVAEFRTRDHTVHKVVIGCYRAECTDGTLASRPQLRAFGVVFSLADLRGVIGVADVAHSLTVFIDRFSQPIEFHYENRFSVIRISGMVDRFASIDRDAVHHFNRRRNHARTDDVRYSLRSVVQPNEKPLATSKPLQVSASISPPPL